MKLFLTNDNDTMTKAGICPSTVRSLSIYRKNIQRPEKKRVCLDKVRGQNLTHARGDTWKIAVNNITLSCTRTGKSMERHKNK